MDFAQRIEFEESVKSKLESKKGLLHVKEEKLGNEIVRMEFDQIIKFEENIKPKLESKEGLMRIKEEKIDSIEEKLNFLSSTEKDLSSFHQTIEFEEDIKPKLESKEGLLVIKKEKTDLTKDLSSIRKEIVEMDFAQTIEFEENIKPKLESKEGFLQIKQEKMDSSEIKAEYLSIKKEPLHINREINDELPTGIDVFETLNGKKCSTCFKVLKSKSQLKRHIFYTHERKEAGMSKEKESKKEKKHLKVLGVNNVDVNSDKKAHKCSKCLRSGSYFDYMDTVDIYVHEGKTVYKCRNCGKVSNNKTQMINHANQEAKKMYQCSICGKVFGQKGVFKEHYRQHKEKKAPLCSMCGSHRW